MQVVINEPSGILEVETLREHVRGDQNANFLSPFSSELRTRGVIIIGSEFLDDIRAIAFALAIDLIDAIYSSGRKLLLQVSSRRHKFGEDDHLVLLEHCVLSQQLDQ